jgi:hypothetical protein
MCDIGFWDALEIADREVRDNDCLQNIKWYLKVDELMNPLAKRNLLTHKQVFGE